MIEANILQNLLKIKNKRRYNNEKNLFFYIGNYNCK